MMMETMKGKLPDYQQQDVILLKDGLVGLPAFKRWVLMEMDPPMPLKWLQSLDNPEFRLPVTEPEYFNPDYAFDLDDKYVATLENPVADDLAVLIVTTVYFLLRRFNSPVRGISIPEDYVLLILLFLTIIFGSHMNLASRYAETGFDITVNDFRIYLSSLAAFKPAVPEEISDSPHYVLMVLHIFFANLFLILFPFSKMIHSVFIFFALHLKRK